MNRLFGFQIVHTLLDTKALHDLAYVRKVLGGLIIRDALHILLFWNIVILLPTLLTRYASHDHKLHLHFLAHCSKLNLLAFPPYLQPTY